jgi:ubiquinone biosynthesis protein
MDRASSRTTLGTIVAALIIGSSLIISVESRISDLGVAGFICAGLLGVYLIVNILRSKKF